MTAASGSIVVIVPAYNAQTTLAACLDSIIAAGFAPGDIVLADDGSNDASRDIATERGVRIVALGGNAGAAAARNAGAAASVAPLIVFVDADVALHPGVRAQVEAFFDANPRHGGLIGSYDDTPPAAGTLSRIRNLLHHHVHQKAGGDVPSFWTGCGAIRRDAFEAVGGFEPGHPLEDVALGMALARRGIRVRLDPALLCTHLKRWTLRSMIRADLLYRALPWSRMLLDPRNADVPAALNAAGRGKASVAATALTLVALPLAILWPAVALAVALCGIALIAALDAGFLTLVARRLGMAAAVQAVGVLWVHYLCAGTGFAAALFERLIPFRGSRT